MGKLYLVPTPVGNMDDITLRAIRVLREVGLVLAEDTRRAGLLLKHHAIEARLLSHHKFNEHRTAEMLAARIAAGEDMALVTDAGTPGISDPGFLLVRAAVEAGAEVECLPGATAFVPALVCSALPCERFAFEGFLPQKKGRHTRIVALQDEPRTMIFYESPHRLVRLLAELADVFGAERRASVSREISKLHEDTQRGTLAQLADHFTATPPKGEIVVVVEGRGGEDARQRKAQRQTHTD
ncbi:MAG: 16S rRNA (cytidine(1402)-2'-O)-methyltransferase [Bacteroidaceae bacterium]|nr:16S rRNA (cytidine(1402)-2'-O)-methyltransferase [Bacteroidaceae bacterium]